ncbi:MAG TPA: hypothetical protein VGL42_17290 [Opitutaceae bacterium]|jgi:hypothetical protein
MAAATIIGTIGAKTKAAETMRPVAARPTAVQEIRILIPAMAGERLRRFPMSRGLRAAEGEAILAALAPAVAEEVAAVKAPIAAEAAEAESITDRQIA